MSRFKGSFKATILFCLFFAAALIPAAYADTTYTDTLTFPFPVGVWTESTTPSSTPEPATVSLLIADVVGLLVFSTPKRAQR